MSPFLRWHDRSGPASSVSKEFYVPVSVEIVEIIIEKGFAESDPGSTEGLGQNDGEW